MAICTLNNVKDRLGITGTKEEVDSVLESLIDEVSKLFETYCDRIFDSAEYTEYYNGEGRSWLYPKHYPITSVSGIWDDSDWDWETTDLIDSTYYRIDNDSRAVVLRDYTLCDFTQNIKIIYTAGYSTIPLDLRLACVVETCRLYNRRMKGHVSDETLPDGQNLTYDLALFTPAVAEILNKYKNKRVA